MKNLCFTPQHDYLKKNYIHQRHVAANISPAPFERRNDILIKNFLTYHII